MARPSLGAYEQQLTPVRVSFNQRRPYVALEANRTLPDVGNGVDDPNPTQTIRKQHLVTTNNLRTISPSNGVERTS